jgi:hypothetical protein
MRHKRARRAFVPQLHGTEFAKPRRRGQHTRLEETRSASLFRACYRGISREGKSEDIDDTILLDAVQSICRRVRVINRSYDIPYIAGYSVDGKTVFIDRHLPRTFRWLFRTIRVEPFS